MGLERSEEEIWENLVQGETINWEYLLDLESSDRERGTNNYKTAIFILKREGVITTEPKGNYFVHGIPYGNSEPKMGGLNLYFTGEDHARKFNEVFPPQGLIAKVL